MAPELLSGKSIAKEFSVELAGNDPSPYGQSGKASRMPLPYSSAANDVWSLGIIFINMLTGKNPWVEPSKKDKHFTVHLLSNRPGRVDSFQSQFNFSHELCFILRRVFDLDPFARPSAAQLFHMIEALPYFFLQKDHGPSSIPLTPVSLKTSVPSAFKKQSHDVIVTNAAARGISAKSSAEELIFHMETSLISPESPCQPNTVFATPYAFATSISNPNTYYSIPASDLLTPTSSLNPSEIPAYPKRIHIVSEIPSSPKRVHHVNVTTRPIFSRRPKRRGSEQLPSPPHGETMSSVINGMANVWFNL